MLAEFYLELLGGKLLWSNEQSVGVRVPGLTLVAQRVADYQPPVWPGASIVHLDLSAGQGPGTDLEEPARRAIRLGAAPVDLQPDPRWRVLLDPAGHPFCITTVTPPPPGPDGEPPG